MGGGGTNSDPTQLSICSIYKISEMQLSFYTTLKIFWNLDHQYNSHFTLYTKDMLQIRDIFTVQKVWNIPF